MVYVYLCYFGQEDIFPLCLLPLPPPELLPAFLPFGATIPHFCTPSFPTVPNHTPVPHSLPNRLPHPAPCPALPPFPTPNFPVSMPSLPSPLPVSPYCHYSPWAEDAFGTMPVTHSCLPVPFIACAQFFPTCDSAFPVCPAVPPSCCMPPALTLTRYLCAVACHLGGDGITSVYYLWEEGRPAYPLPTIIPIQ